MTFYNWLTPSTLLCWPLRICRSGFGEDRGSPSVPFRYLRPLCGMFCCRFARHRPEEGHVFSPRPVPEDVHPPGEEEHLPHLQSSRTGAAISHHRQHHQPCLARRGAFHTHRRTQRHALFQIYWLHIIEIVPICMFLPIYRNTRL